jgi:O-antigen ligase
MFYLINGFCLYVALQIAPLPRPHSLAPDATFSHLLRVATYAGVYFLVRERVIELGRHAWSAVIPILIVAAGEAVAGLGQLAAGGPFTEATGSFRDHSHYACMLSMALPLAVAFAARKYSSAHQRAIPVAALTAACLILLAGIVAAGSRMAFVSTFLSLALFGTLVLHTRLVRPTLGKLFAGSTVLILVFVVALSGSAQIIPRFLKLFSPEAARFELPFPIWAQAAAVFRAHPWLGCGLGALGEGIRRLFLSNVNYYAQNDYLQLLAELGVAGALIGGLVVGVILWQALRAIYTIRDPRFKWLAVGVFCSLATLLIHSIIEFNLYIPANAFAFAWIAAIPSGLRCPKGLEVLISPLERGRWM